MSGCVEVAARSQMQRPGGHQARVQQVVRGAVEGSGLLRRRRGRRERGVVGVMGKEHAVLAGCDPLRQRCRAFFCREDHRHALVVPHRIDGTRHQRQAGQPYPARPAGRCGRTGERKAPGPGCRQQEVGVPQRVLEQAVQADHQHHHQRATLRGAQAARCRPGRARRAPQPPAQQRQHQRRQRQAEFDRQLQRQVVGVVEEGRGAAGEGCQGPGKVEFAPAHASPGLLLDQRQRVGPDAEARARDVALGQARRATKTVARQRRPLRHAPPGGGVHQRRGQQQHARVPRQSTVGPAPQGQQQHADQAGARRRQHHAEDHQRQQGRRPPRPDAAQLGQRHHRDARPQQQAAQVIGLAQVAHRAARNAGAGDPVAVGQGGRVDLHDGHAGVQHTGQQPADAEQREHVLGRRRIARPGASCCHHRCGCQQAQRRQRQACWQPAGPPGPQHRGSHHRQRGRHHPAMAPGPRRRHQGREHTPQAQGQRLVQEGRRRRQVVGQQRGRGRSQGRGRSDCGAQIGGDRGRMQGVGCGARGEWQRCYWRPLATGAGLAMTSRRYTCIAAVDLNLRPHPLSQAQEPPHACHSPARRH